jgi:hypothetical protein
MRLHGPVGYIAPRSTVALTHLRGNHGGKPHPASFAGGLCVRVRKIGHYGFIKRAGSL